MTEKAVKFTFLAALLLTAGGCHKSVGGQVVATVNDDEITQQQLNADIQDLKISANDDKQKVSAQIVQRLVDRQVLVQEAKKQSLDKQPEYLGKLIKLQDELLVQLLVEKMAKTISIPGEDQVKKYIADNPYMFAQRKHYSIDQLAFPAAKFASVQSEMLATHSLDDIVKVLTAHNIPFKNGGHAVVDTAKIPPKFAEQLGKQPANEPFIIPQDGIAVAGVIKGTAATPTPDAEARPLALQMLRRKAEGDAVEAMLKRDKDAAKIQYAQGFAPSPAK